MVLKEKAADQKVKKEKVKKVKVRKPLTADQKVAETARQAALYIARKANGKQKAAKPLTADQKAKKVRLPPLPPSLLSIDLNVPLDSLTEKARQRTAEQKVAETARQAALYIARKANGKQKAPKVKSAQRAKIGKGATPTQQRAGAKKKAVKKKAKKTEEEEGEQEDSALMGEGGEGGEEEEEEEEEEPPSSVVIFKRKQKMEVSKEIALVEALCTGPGKPDFFDFRDLEDMSEEEGEEFVDDFAELVIINNTRPFNDIRHNKWDRGFATITKQSGFPAEFMRKMALEEEEAMQGAKAVSKSSKGKKAGAAGAAGAATLWQRLSSLLCSHHIKRNAKVVYDEDYAGKMKMLDFLTSPSVRKPFYNLYRATVVQAMEKKEGGCPASGCGEEGKRLCHSCNDDGNGMRLRRFVGDPAGHGENVNAGTSLPPSFSLSLSLSHPPSCLSSTNTTCPRPDQRWC